MMMQLFEMFFRPPFLDYCAGSKKQKCFTLLDFLTQGTDFLTGTTKTKLKFTDKTELKFTESKAEANCPLRCADSAACLWTDGSQRFSLRRQGVSVTQVLVGSKRDVSA